MKTAEIKSPTIDLNKGICPICRKKVVSKWCDFITEYNNSNIYFRNYKDLVEANRYMAQYVTCDIPMCSECANEVSFNTHICPHHMSLLRQVEIPDKYQRRRQSLERVKIFEMLSGLK